MAKEWENIYLKIAPTLIHFGISGVQLSLAPFQKTDNAVLSNIFLDDENKLWVFLNKKMDYFELRTIAKSFSCDTLEEMCKQSSG